MASIIEFLEARIAEDESDALTDAAEMDRSSVSIQFDCDTQARFSPARVLAECAAKRALVKLHEYEWMGPDDAAGKGCVADYEDWPCPTVRHLAAIYKDHPGYQQEWALDG